MTFRKKEEIMSSYQETIIEDTGCNPADSVMIEHFMRENIFHSKLDWQTRVEFRRAARMAAEILAEDRLLYMDYFAKMRAVFEAMRQAAKT
jgi:hypothetical protein